MTLTDILDKKIIIIATISILIFVAGIVIVTVNPLSRKETEILPTPTQTTLTDKIIINDVPVNNVYENAKHINSNNDALLIETETYNIVYLGNAQKFTISILTDDINTARAYAENSFLELTGLTRSEACQIQVGVYIANFLDSQHAGYEYPLSFCME